MPNIDEVFAPTDSDVAQWEATVDELFKQAMQAAWEVL